MEPETNNIDPATLNKARQIPKWAGRYAHNRNYPYGFVRMGLFLLAFAVIGGSGELAGDAAHEGYRTAALALFAICLASAILKIYHQKTGMSSSYGFCKGTFVDYNGAYEVDVKTAQPAAFVSSSPDHRVCPICSRIPGRDGSRS